MQKPVSIAAHTQFANIVTRTAIEHEGKYLLVQEGKSDVHGKWGFPGGKVDVGEVLSVSAVREIFEETGIKVELTGVLAVQYVLWGEIPGFTLELDLVGTAQSIPDSFSFNEEILSVDWFSVEQILQLGAEGKLRNPGHEAIARRLQSGELLPIAGLIERDGTPPLDVKK